MNWFEKLFAILNWRKPKPVVEQTYYQIPKRQMKYITVHCTATPEGRHVTVDEIDKWHKARGWSGIGYHWVVCLDGSLHKGRPENKTGAHVKGFNKDNLAIVFVGGCDKQMNPKDTRTEAQKKTIDRFLKEQRKKHPNAIIQGHRDFPNVKKECPSYDAKKEHSHI